MKIDIIYHSYLPHISLLEYRGKIDKAYILTGIRIIQSPVYGSLYTLPTIQSWLYRWAIVIRYQDGWL